MSACWVTGVTCYLLGLLGGFFMGILLFGARDDGHRDDALEPWERRCGP